MSHQRNLEAPQYIEGLRHRCCSVWSCGYITLCRVTVKSIYMNIAYIVCDILIEWGKRPAFIWVQVCPIYLWAPCLRFLSRHPGVFTWLHPHDHGRSLFIIPLCGVYCRAWYLWDMPLLEMRPRLLVDISSPLRGSPQNSSFWNPAHRFCAYNTGVGRAWRSSIEIGRSLRGNSDLLLVSVCSTNTRYWWKNKKKTWERGLWF